MKMGPATFIYSVLFAFLTAKAIAQTTYTLQIDLPGSQAEVWEVITDFNRYPEWNSILSMANNDKLEIGEKFHVNITNEKGNKSRFKAKTLSKEPNRSFAAQQAILGKWVFQQTPSPAHTMLLEVVTGLRSKHQEFHT